MLLYPVHAHALLLLTDRLPARTTSQIRAANSLVSTIHSMKLLLLLSDEAQIAKRRDAELRNVQIEKSEAQRKVAVLLDELLLSSKGESSQSLT